MKLFKQILTLALVFVLFLCFNLGFYFTFTVRCGNNFGTDYSPRSIQAEKYLPFDEGSLIYKTDASLKITEDIPVLDGATALLPVYSAIANAVYPEDSCGFDGNGFTADSAIQYRNTAGAYKAVVDGTADIIFCAGPSEEQRQYAKDKGVELVYVPIGYEAFVFFVNADNPVSALTVEQIQGIYTGKYTNWSEVGGKSRLINPLQRPSGSGSQTMMLKFMDGKEMDKSLFASFGGAIGFSFRYYLDGIVDNSGVKMLSVNGVYPSAENIRNGTYPIVSNFYAVYRADNANKNIAPLIDYILSEEGRQIINQSGYVGIS